MTADRQRIDLWLWHARIVKSRTRAATLAAGGHVRVNRDKVGKASHQVRPGDVITLFWGGRVRVVEVASIGARRGPAAEAATLYVDRSPPPAPRVRPPPKPAERPQGSVRPTKKQRRQTDRLRSDGAT